jgi:integrase
MAINPKKSALIPESSLHVRKTAKSRSFSDSFIAISKRYLAHQKPKLNAESYSREKRILALNLAPFFGVATPLPAISQLDVRSYVAYRSGNLSAASITRELGILKHMFSLAVEWGVITTSPSDGVKAPPLSARLRYLEPFEVRQVIDACPDWLQPITRLALATGMSRSELLELRWRDVDWKHGTLTIVRKSVGNRRTIPLNKLAREALAPIACIKPRADDRIFTGRSISLANVSQAFLRACRSVGISDVRFHDLRRTAATWMMMRGVDVQTLSQLLGHSDLRMAGRYQCLSQSSVLHAMKAIDDIFDDTIPQPKQARNAR